MSDVQRENVTTTESGPSYGLLMIGQLRERLVAHVAAQRAKGWTDFHPETICHRCGGVNVPSWWVDSDRFNLAMGPHVGHQWNGIVCPGCFVVLHEEATGLRCTWTLVPDQGSTFRPIESEANDD